MPQPVSRYLLPVVVVLMLAAMIALPLVTRGSDSAWPGVVKENKRQLHHQAADNLAGALTAMDEASKALTDGNKDKAAAAIDKAKGLVKDTQTALLASAPGAK